jgi:hypothetical protein
VAGCPLKNVIRNTVIKKEIHIFNLNNKIINNVNNWTCYVEGMEYYQKDCITGYVNLWRDEHVQQGGGTNLHAQTLMITVQH